jgi:YidC/Oxa1 family membrane protein insertase
MHSPDSKNFILAIVLSMVIIFGWQYFFAQPLLKQPDPTTTTTTGTTPGTTTTGGGTVPGTTPGITVQIRDEALKASPRVAIETPDLVGSINLAGAQFDDLKLVKYREQVSSTSPAVTLLSPSGTANATFVEQGLVAPSGMTVKLPDAKTLWTAPANAKLGPGAPVTLTWDNGEGLLFSRTISIDDAYVFTVTQSVQNTGTAQTAVIPYARVQRQDTPHTSGYWVFFEGLLGVQNDKLVEWHYSDLLEEKEPSRSESTGGWLGFTDKYWAAVIMPDQSKVVTSTYQHSQAAGRDIYQTDYLAKDALVVAPGATVQYQDTVFAGAKVVKTINAIQDKYKIAKFDLMIDWGWFEFLTKPMFYLLEWIKSLVGNFGVAILITTVLVKLAVFPLANKSYASMSKMKKLQPEMERLKQAYPDDRMKQQQEMMEIYKREKVSPLSGCLPVVVQIPVFFSLYKVILTSIELRHAPFFGWIHDLSAPDPTSLFNLFGLIPWSPPQMLMIGVWPLLMGITMWVQMRLNPTPPDPVQASMFNWMPVIFTFMLGTFPVGLVIYWAWSNLLSIIQQTYIMKKHGTEVNILGNIRESLPFLKKKAS